MSSLNSLLAHMLSCVPAVIPRRLATLTTGCSHGEGQIVGGLVQTWFPFIPNTARNRRGTKRTANEVWRSGVYLLHDQTNERRNITGYLQPKHKGETTQDQVGSNHHVSSESELS